MEQEEEESSEEEQEEVTEAQTELEGGAKFGMTQSKHLTQKQSETVTEHASLRHDASLNVDPSVQKIEKSED